MPLACSIVGTIIYNPASQSPCLSRTPHSQSIASGASSPPWLTSSPRSPGPGGDNRDEKMTEIRHKAELTLDLAEVVEVEQVVCLLYSVILRVSFLPIVFLPSPPPPLMGIVCKSEVA